MECSEAVVKAAEAGTAAQMQQREDLRDVGEVAERQEIRALIAEAIYSLPETYQLPAAMRYLEEIPYREIAERMGLREEALRKRIHRANQMLRRKLRKLWPEGEGI
jgi:RNA polymerase sigma-70 factor (ECF subfamily)